MSSRSINGVFGEDNGSFDSIGSKYDVSKKSNYYGSEFKNIEQFNFNENELHNSFDKIDALLQHSTNLNNEANGKLETLSDINEELEILIYNNSKQVPKVKTHLATPIDEDDLDKSVQIRSNDIFASSELDDSELEDIEFEINDKVSRMIQTNYNDDNIIKLKNTINSTFELLKFKENGTQLMKINDEIQGKSEGMIEKLNKLIETFT